jgi:hypothetical protein
MTFLRALLLTFVVYSFRYPLTFTSLMTPQNYRVTHPNFDDKVAILSFVRDAESRHLKSKNVYISEDIIFIRLNPGISVLNIVTALTFNIRY